MTENPIMNKQWVSCECKTPINASFDAIIDAKEPNS
jgi:hypothetical protein